MRQRFNFLALIFFFCGQFFCFSVRAADLWLKDIPLKTLQTFYHQSGYDGKKGYLMIPSYRYPRIFLKNFPSDYKTLTDETERNALFIKILTPLALKLNQELLQERRLIEDLKTRFDKEGTLSKKDLALLEKKANKYDVFTRLTGSARQDLVLKELLNRIDQIPPSILITASAIDTNFGTARALQEGNSLYKTYVWNGEKGLKPRGENLDDTYRLKTYPSLYDSLSEFALKLNSQKAFAMMRTMRAERRKNGSVPSGQLMAPYIYGNSPLKNYAGLFDYTLAYYELLEIDKSELDDIIIPEEVAKTVISYRTKQ